MMQINKNRNRKSYRRASLRLYIHRPYQLSHVTPSCALPLAVCILMLPMLVVVNEHMQLATMSSITFSHSPLVLSSLNNVIPSIVLQDRVEQSNIGHLNLSCSPSRCNIQHTSSSIGLRVCSRGRVMIVVMLLRLYIHRPYQLSHVTPSCALPLAVCILMLPMLVVVNEHMQLATMSSITFSHSPLVLSSLNNVIPSIVLQDRVEQSNIGHLNLSCSPSRCNIQHTSSSIGLRVCSRGRVMIVVMLLLLLLSGDIEMNPGPLGQEDLKSLHSELHPVSDKWFSIGVQLQVPIGTLKCIRSDIRTVAECLLEMLTVWLRQINPPPTWNILTEALESPPVGEILLAQRLRDKYCPRTETGTTDGFPTLGRTFQPNAPQVQHGEHGNPLSSHTPLYQFTQSAVQLVQPQASASSYSTVSTHLTPPEITTFPHPHITAHREVLLSTTSGGHGGGGLGDGGAELSTPAVKRKCLPNENSVSLVSSLERESVYGESVTSTRYFPYWQQQCSTFQPNFQLLHHSLSRPPHLQVGHHLPHQLQLPTFQLPLEQPSYQQNGLIHPYPPSYHHSYHHPSNPPLTRYGHSPTSEIHYFQSHHQLSTNQSIHQPSFHMHPPIYKLSHMPPSTLLEVYANFLQSCYVNHECTSTKWPHLDVRDYVKLAVISNEYANKEELVKFREQTIRGSVDDILEWKAPIEMKDILKPNYNPKACELFPVTQLLIEGAPGIGKSTFAWEICRKWGQHQLFNEYSLVVLLRFRDKRVHEAKSVSDLFHYPLPELQSDIVHDIVLSGGYGLLLILEGFDEAPASKRIMDSIFVRLFTGQELPKATVILTTRPSASAELRKVCRNKHSRRIEIVGFGKKKIDEYIQCAFSDEQSRSAIKEYLSLYPHIHSMMYVPLNSAIVTHVYESCKSSGTVVPKTMTQLYSSLIRTLLLRYLKDKEEYKDTCTNTNNFKDLPRPVYDQFCEICKIAYTGIVSAETELIFQDLPSDFDSMGLMQTCPELYVDRGSSVSYNFLHLTLQEYLAAYHISQQSRDEQVAFMEEGIFDMQMVVRFLAGLTILGREFWDVVREFAFEDIPSSSFLSEERNNIKLEILHCLFESQDPSAITSILGFDCVCLFDESISAFDLYVLGYCIAHSSCNWKLELSYLDLESVEIFLRVLNLQPSTGNIKKLRLMADQTAVHLLIDNMPQMLVFQNLTHLGLDSCGLTSETCNFLSTCTNLIQHLEYLNLSQNVIGEGGTVNLIKSLIKLSTIRELDLNDACIGFEDCKALGELLASSKYIQVLDISSDCVSDIDDGVLGNELSPESIQLIVNGLSHNTSLEKLNMRSSSPNAGSVNNFIIFSSENVVHLASVLKLNTRLKDLDISGCIIQSSNSVHLAKALEENTATQLQTLSLYGNQIGSEGAVAFANMLATNKSLAQLNMRKCTIQEEDAVCLAKIMDKNSTLREFDISDNQIGSEGAVAFGDMLATNKSLVELGMRECSIQGEGVVCMAKALERNSTVRKFNISNNPIGSEGAVAFASMLKKNQCLKTLDLCDDSVGVEGALQLIESLKYNTTLEELWLSEKCKPPSFSTLDKTLQNRVTFT